MNHDVNAGEKHYVQDKEEQEKRKKNENNPATQLQKIKSWATN
jgi:hypothetical protein